MSAALVERPALDRGSAPSRRSAPVMRSRLPDARDDKLFFGQVREDPTLELAALHPASHQTIVAVSSAGCTLLSLLASGAGRVIGVDLNATQHHLVELKLAALSTLTARGAVAFLGGDHATPASRLATYAALRPQLTPESIRWWDARPDAIARGPIIAGASERFIGIVVGVLRRFVHSEDRIRRLLECSTLAEQDAYVRFVWSNRRWRWLFELLLNRLTMSRAYDPAFFAHATTPSFATYFRETAERTLREIPIVSNYFVHQMLTGRYPTEVLGGVPPYLSAPGAAAIRARRDRLSLVDGSLTTWLRTQPAASVDGFAISNICEWLAPADVEALFAEIARVAVPGARVVFRNFVGWTEVPDALRDRIVEDRALGERLMHADRSCVQRRIAVCRVTA